MKIAPIILVCLVTLSVIYGCSVALVTHQFQNTKPIPSIEGIDFLKSLGTPSYRLAADPIDSPRPGSRIT